MGARHRCSGDPFRTRIFAARRLAGLYWRFARISAFWLRLPVQRRVVVAKASGRGLDLSFHLCSVRHLVFVGSRPRWLATDASFTAACGFGRVGKHATGGSPSDALCASQTKWQRHRPVYVVAIIGIFWSGWQISDARFVHHQPFPAEKTTALTDGEKDWKYYGRTAEGQRYSPLAQITPANVAQLKLAWRFDSGDVMQKGEDKAGREFNLEVTPIKVGNALYICTPHRRDRA